MQPLDQLVQQARALGDGMTVDEPSAEAELRRQLQICNACRYCEGFCAVFPAMARRLSFPSADLHYLANLCHHCGACGPACQYASPHEFAVDLPRALARVRATTYARHAWPAAAAGLYQRNGRKVAGVLVLALAGFLAAGAASQGSLWGAQAGGNFYAVFPHGWLVALFAPVFALALLALVVSVRSFWRQPEPGPASAAAWREAGGHALSLHHLGGGHGEGCNDEDDAYTLRRRHAHHATFYGFMLCFAATSVATVYHYGLGWPAPYPLLSAPVLLGSVGGLLLMAGTAWQYRLLRRRAPSHSAPELQGMDVALLALLFFSAASGLGLLALRESAAMPLLLCLHLGAVMALFLTLPYGKLAHGAYRAAALLKWAIERRQPSALKLGGD